ncbi:MAG: AAA family ATPase, partial [Candidatus Dadabacteria bacterium]
MQSWYTHFGLTDDPFDATSSSFRYYYGARYGLFSLRFERALEERRGHVLVTGPAGTGKSTLVKTVLGRAGVCAHAAVSAAEAAPVAVIDALLRSREPLESGFSATRKRAALLELVERARRSQRSIVCVVDDAHLAAPGQIRELADALDITPEARRVIQLVLVGRSRLLLTLQSRALARVASRVATRIETDLLSPAEIADFLFERLEGSGAADPAAVLPPASMTAIARHARGNIAVASALGRAVLARAAQAGARSVSAEMVDEAAAV